MILFAGFVYGLLLPFFLGQQSCIGAWNNFASLRGQKAFFWLWAVFTAGSVIVNVQYMYKKFSFNNKLLNTLCVLGLFSMVVVALTLGHSIDSRNPKRLAQRIATGLFIAFVVASMVLFFFLERKKHNSFKILMLCVFLVLASFLVIFAVVGKSAVMEMVPIALLQIFYIL